MAIYHLTAKAIRRKDGRSAVAAAAYRAGELIVDQSTGVEHNYTKKRDVLDAALLLPHGGTADRSEFWNRLEKHHKRRDAVTAREIEISLPAELDADQRQALTIQFARELADKYGVAVDVALHAPRTVSDRDLVKNPDQFHMIDPDTGKRHNGNWHAHLLFSACYVDADGNLGKKAVELDPIHCQRHKIPNMTDVERGRWCDLQNAALEKVQLVERVDHRSFEARGSDQVPTVHLGGYAARMRREGTPELSENAALNAEINGANKEVRELRKQLAFENAERHIEQRHQLQIRAEMRALYAAQQRVYERKEEAEWQEWIARPDVDPTSGRIITEWVVDACIERESQHPENRPSPGGIKLEELALRHSLETARPAPSPAIPKASPAPTFEDAKKPSKPAPLEDSEPVAHKPTPVLKTPEPEPQTPPEPAFDAQNRALEIVKMETAEERHGALHAASSLGLDDFDALMDELDPLMGSHGELSEEGCRLRAEMMPKRAAQPSIESEKLQEWPLSSGGPKLW